MPKIQKTSWRSLSSWVSVASLVAAVFAGIFSLGLALVTVNRAATIAFDSSVEAEAAQGLLVLDTKGLERLWPRLDPVNRAKWQAAVEAVQFGE